MFTLNEMQIQMVSGGYLVYVTDEWKQTEATINGITHGIACTILGGYLGFALSGGYIENQIMGSLIWGALSGLGGYFGGYYLSVLENSSLQSNEWYDFVYTVYYY